jgi:hypothetical protein
MFFIVFSLNFLIFIVTNFCFNRHFLRGVIGAQSPNRIARYAGNGHPRSTRMQYISYARYTKRQHFSRVPLFSSLRVIKNLMK